MRKLLRVLKWILVIIPPVIIFVLVIDDLEFEATIFTFLYSIILLVLGTRWIIRELKLVNQLKKEKKATELLHLKSQVSPHFFFNTLNNLYGLVEKDSKKAQELILKLSEMMRYSIYEGEKSFVPIKQEVTYLKNFIELHEMRYHKKVDISFLTEILSEETRLMPLLFILLVENAFKHGVENLRENAYVHMKLKSTEHEILFEIENNFDLEDQKTEQGIGLTNLKRRLELMYPNKHSLDLMQKDDTYKAQLILHII